MGVFHIAICGLPTLYNIFPRSQKKGMILDKGACLNLFTILFEFFLILRKAEWDKIINVLRSLFKVPEMWSNFKEILNIPNIY